jgi:hypothetical protein
MNAHSPIQTRDACAVAPATQATAKTGHKGGPKTTPFGLHAAWLRFANELELRRLAKLHVRIERKQSALQCLIKERQAIMNRSIRRMRRNQGKT